MRCAFLTFLAIGTAMVGAGGTAFAQDGGTQMAPQAASEMKAGGFDAFIPDPQTQTRLDYGIWESALDMFVLRMGPSLRQSPGRAEASPGTRRIFGHTSLYRLEGNRVAFSYLDDEVKASLAEYLADLQRIGTEIDVATLPRNEQLSFWINLHNVAVIKTIAENWPVRQPKDIEIGDITYDRAPFMEVAGVKMSPYDIRTKIVYPNWSDPRIIYAFFHGEIGGPSIAKDAYTPSMLRNLLQENAEEFVNSMRGTEKRGDTLYVSELYEEARPFYFQNWPSDLRDHLNQFAVDELKEDMAKTTQIDASIKEHDIADLAYGVREPTYSEVTRSDEYGRTASFRVPPSIARLMEERMRKYQRLREQGVPTGRVYVLDMEGAEEIE